MDSTELLTDVYQNAEIAREIIGRMIKRCEYPEMRKCLADQFAEYHAICEDAKAGLYERGMLPRTIGKSRRRVMFSAMSFNLKIDKTPSHMSEMLMQGSLLGVIDISKALTANEKADDYSKHLANKLIETEVNNIHRMREYL